VLRPAVVNRNSTSIFLRVPVAPIVLVDEAAMSPSAVSRLTGGNQGFRSLTPLILVRIQVHQPICMIGPVDHQLEGSGLTRSPWPRSHAWRGRDEKRFDDPRCRRGGNIASACRSQPEFKSNGYSLTRLRISFRPLCGVRWALLANGFDGSSSFSVDRNPVSRTYTRT
jgi:hypothetical protein